MIKIWFLNIRYLCRVKSDLIAFRHMSRKMASEPRNVCYYTLENISVLGFLNNKSKLKLVSNVNETTSTIMIQINEILFFTKRWSQLTL